MRAGEKLSIAVKVERTAGWDGDVQFAGFDLPTGATVALVTVGKGATKGKVELTMPAKAKAGTYTFTINGAGQAPRDYGRPADPKGAKPTNDTKEDYKPRLEIVWPPVILAAAWWVRLTLATLWLLFFLWLASQLVVACAMLASR